MYAELILNFIAALIAPSFVPNNDLNLTYPQYVLLLLIFFMVAYMLVTVMKVLVFYPLYFVAEIILPQSSDHYEHLGTDEKDFVSDVWFEKYVLKQLFIGYQASQKRLRMIKFLRIFLRRKISYIALWEAANSKDVQIFKYVFEEYMKQQDLSSFHHEFVKKAGGVKSCRQKCIQMLVEFVTLINQLQMLEIIYQANKHPQTLFFRSFDLSKNKQTEKQTEEDVYEEKVLIASKVSTQMCRFYCEHLPLNVKVNVMTNLSYDCVCKGDLLTLNYIHKSTDIKPECISLERAMYLNHFCIVKYFLELNQRKKLAYFDRDVLKCLYFGKKKIDVEILLLLSHYIKISKKTRQ
jgi:hypothetical protein